MRCSSDFWTQGDRPRARIHSQLRSTADAALRFFEFSAQGYAARSNFGGLIPVDETRPIFLERATYCSGSNSNMRVISDVLQMNNDRGTTLPVQILDFWSSECPVGGLEEGLLLKASPEAFLSGAKKNE